MLKKLLLFSLLAIAIGVQAQNYTFPKNVQLKTEEDYRKSEPEFLKAFDFLMSHDPSDIAGRKDANMFIITWLSGVPYIGVSTDQNIWTFIGNKENAQLLMLCMGGWVKYSIDTKKYNDEIMGNYKGLEAVIQFCKKNPDTFKDSSIKELTEKYDKGTLKDWIQSKISARTKK